MNKTVIYILKELRIESLANFDDIIYNLLEGFKKTKSINAQDVLPALESNVSKPVLNFNGQRYDMNRLSDDIRGLVDRIRIADRQISKYEDTRKLLAIGRKSIYLQIQEQLKDINEL